MRRPAGIVTALVLALFAAPAAAGQDVVEERPLAGPQSAHDVRRFWTPERMQTAVGRELLEAESAAVERAADASASPGVRRRPSSSRTRPRTRTGPSGGCSSRSRARVSSPAARR